MSKIKIISKSEKGSTEIVGNSYLVNNIMIKDKEAMRVTITSKETLEGLLVKITYAFNGEKYHSIKEFLV